MQTSATPQTHQTSASRSCELHQGLRADIRLGHRPDPGMRTHQQLQGGYSQAQWEMESKVWWETAPSKHAIECTNIFFSSPKC